VTARIRVGIIGLGVGCAVHAPAFGADARATVVAVAGRDAGRAADAAARLGGGVRGLGDWRALVDAPDVDAVSIAVPPAAQPAVVEAAAAAGKAVFCEKPLAASLADAERALAAVRAAGVAHAIDFTFPGIDAWQRARALLAEGRLGRVVHVSYRWHVETWASRAGIDTWKRRPTEGGGVLYNFGSHVLHNIEWLVGPLGDLGAVVHGTGVRHGRAVTLAARLAGDGGDVRVDIATDAPHGGGHHVAVYGEAGTLVLANPGADYASGFAVDLFGREDGSPVRVVAPVAAPDGDGRVAVVARLAARFLDAVAGGPPASPNLSDGMRVQVLLDAAARSAVEPGPVPAGEPCR
jgi:predicted dehydrogenase